MKSTRQAFGESLRDLGKKHAHLVVLDADLSKSTKSDLFAKDFPERFFEMGIAEANMIGTAAGLSLTGKLPFACSFACFLTGRYDTIRMSLSYSNMNVRLVGTHAGVGIGDDGHSQMGLEDISLMRSLPHMTIFQPVNALQTAQIMEYLVEKHKGPSYLRLTRQNLPTTELALNPDPFKIDSLVVDPQASILIVATGATTHEALQAHKLLLDHKIPSSVLNVKALKPFDTQTLRTHLSPHIKQVVTVEDHSVIGGLGSVVAEYMAQNPSGAALLRLGIQDTFGESGDPAALYEKHGISAQAIAQRLLGHTPH